MGFCCLKKNKKFDVHTLWIKFHFENNVLWFMFQVKFLPRDDPSLRLHGLWDVHEFTPVFTRCAMTEQKVCPPLLQLHIHAILMGSTSLHIAGYQSQRYWLKYRHKRLRNAHFLKHFFFYSWREFRARWSSKLYYTALLLHLLGVRK